MFDPLINHLNSNSIIVFIGKQILHNFLFGISGLNASFTLQKREQECIDYIRRVVGTEKVVLMLVSGGVDSAVCAALLHKALREGEDTSRVQAIHIDNGFLRKEESDQVVNSLQELGLNLRVTTIFSYNFPVHLIILSVVEHVLLIQHLVDTASC